MSITILDQLQAARTSNQNSESSSETIFERRVRLIERRVRWYNANKGTLEGYDCPLCLNRGDIAYIKNGYEYVRPCSCIEIRRGMRRAENSGLDSLLQRCRFENFNTSEPWQLAAKSKAIEFVSAPAGTWFYIGGQPGSGKTHLCTAIAGELMRQGKAAFYCLWRDMSVKLRAEVNDSEAYEADISRLKTVELLYLDDFIKQARGGTPTQAEIGLAFEIVNARYNSGLTTVISSEFTIDEVLRLDEATASRIIERSGDYCLTIARDTGKNYRLPA